MKTKVLLSHYGPAVEAVFDDKKTLNEILTYISKYIDRNSEQLYYIAPTKRIVFNTAGPDGAIILDNLHIDPKEMKKTIATIPSIRPKAAVLKKPVPVSITLLLREAVKRKNKSAMDLLMMYLVLSLYWSVQYRTFKYEPNEAVVQYTINNLTNKYYIRSKGNLFEALLLTAQVNHEGFEKRLLMEDDEKLIDYIMSLRTRISSMVVRIAQAIYKDLAEKNYINTVQDDTSEEGFYETQNVSFFISTTLDKVKMNFYQNRINPKLVGMSARLCQVPSLSLTQIMTDIKGEEPGKVEDILRSILILYLEDGKYTTASVGSKKFIAESLAVFGKSNTTDQKILQIKDHLSYFLEKYSETYMNTDRLATKNNYRKAVFSYFVFLLAYAAN